ncbi:MAG TPA: hypothetical protein VND96_16700 [Candidatus Micrarchaeaceae archaeon]|nr:hypothetical protein [Candidatus Micrarchaeaceae archaeon]
MANEEVVLAEAIGARCVRKALDDAITDGVLLAHATALLGSSGPAD